MKTLTAQDYARAARHLGCEEAAIRAVVAVESSGPGFLSDGRCKILFEGHIFYRETMGRYAQTHPTLCFEKWTREHYARGQTADERGAGEIARLGIAMLIDRLAALRWARYGKFQIMGFNHQLCMYPNVRFFYQAMQCDEASHLDAFCHLIKSMCLAGALRRLEWAVFAHGYKGSAYRENDYDVKLARAYKLFREICANGDTALWPRPARPIAESIGYASAKPLSGN